MTPFDFALISVGLLFFCNLIGLALSFLPFWFNYFSNRRIQCRKVNISVFKVRLPLIAFNMMLLFVLSFVGFYLVFPFIDQSFAFIGLSVFIQLLIVLLLDDFFFYFLHRWLHTNEWLLKKVHRIHHIASAPFALDYIYVHPLEWILGYIGPVLGFALILLFGELSCWTVWLYVILRTMHELDIHSGIRSTLISYLPIFSKAEHHDLHHAKLDGNYASTFVLWDKIFGTQIKQG